MVLFLASALVPAVSARTGARVGVGRRRTLIETIHFGDFYLPSLISAGPYLHAFWRPKEQSGTERMVATSTDGGRSFGPARKMRVPGIANLLSTAGDAAGNSYFVGLQYDSQVVIVKADSKLKNFTTSAPLNLEGGIVSAALAFGTDGKTYLAMQRQSAVYIMNGTQTTADQVSWAVSTDGAATFTVPTPTNDRVYETSDYEPAITAGPDGAVWLVYAKDSTEERAAASGQFAGGRIIARRIDSGAGDEVEIPRAPGAAGRLYHVLAAAAPNGVRVSWAEVTIGAAEQLQSVYFASYTVGTPIVAPTEPLATVGIAHFHFMARTDDGKIVVFLHGAGHDSNQPEPAIIARASDDDGATFGPVNQVTGYPPVTTLFVTSDGKRGLGLWTDTRRVQFAAFTAKPAA